MTVTNQTSMDITPGAGNMENKCVCSICGVTKPRFKDGVIGGQAKFVDESGRTWQRRKCPDCYRLWYREYAKNRKKSIKVDKSPRKPWGGRQFQYIKRGTKLRPCGNCGEETVNYFNCKSCLSVLCIGEANFMEGWGA